ncbi:hypothetical protein GW17_00026418 [Ensete ventricosum]|nr:hypothetical protein GW17_00026418 [Ensete ventricosum]RZS06978.1 hypothetical protein BHM03_00037741 [Ensete ventricosum]
MSLRQRCVADLQAPVKSFSTAKDECSEEYEDTEQIHPWSTAGWLRRRTPPCRAVALSAVAISLLPGEQLRLLPPQDFVEGWGGYATVDVAVVKLVSGSMWHFTSTLHHLRHCSPDSSHSHSPPPPRASFVDRMAEIDEALLMELLEEPCAEEVEDDDRLGYVIRSLEAEISNMNAVTTGDERGSSAGAEEASDDGGWEELLSAVDGEHTATRAEEELFDCIDVGAVSDWFMDWDV